MLFRVRKFYLIPSEPNAGECICPIGLFYQNTLDFKVFIFYSSGCCKDKVNVIMDVNCFPIGVYRNVWVRIGGAILGGSGTF